MAIRHLYLARHGVADVFGELTDTGRRQMDHLGERLAGQPITTVWHSPLPRASASTYALAEHLPNTAVAEAAELIDNVPYVPPLEEIPLAWRGFFDGYDRAEAAAGRQTADALTDRFATAPDRPTDDHLHEILITHDYPIAWLVRHALDAPPIRWLGLNSANAALTMINFDQQVAPSLIMFNDLSHLPGDLRWTGFGDVRRP